ncbi:sigma-70 family RNA polymerase sigma factor [Dyadobacter sandarakinus]|uniref:Sigma-70 family RNA polymerase sigma factor n=1 Tax=Dyadobacter sandarakinus TaxID=2747268 RepID=A0ABX7IE46_9BACT|nr:sigma-70 family RNA polymerase sigma factor [Dyadobacter sandarakinus]
MSEEEQLSAYRKTGDIRLLGTIYQPYMELVFAVCYKYLRDEDDSKDAVMQIFEKLVVDLRVHEVTRFKNWLHTVARNYCLMRLRETTLLPVAPDLQHLMVDTAEDAPGPLETEGRLEQLDACLEKLLPDQRKAVEMFYLHEKCYREICSEMDLEFNKVKSHIQNGKRNLKICMEKNGRI